MLISVDCDVLLGRRWPVVTERGYLRTPRLTHRPIVARRSIVRQCANTAVAADVVTNTVSRSSTPVATGRPPSHCHTPTGTRTLRAFERDDGRQVWVGVFDDHFNYELSGRLKGFEVFVANIRRRRAAKRFRDRRTVSRKTHRYRWSARVRSPFQDQKPTVTRKYENVLHSRVLIVFLKYRCDNCLKNKIVRHSASTCTRRRNINAFRSALRTAWRVRGSGCFAFSVQPHASGRN